MGRPPGGLKFWTTKTPDKTTDTVHNPKLARYQPGGMIRGELPINGGILAKGWMLRRQARYRGIWKRVLPNIQSTYEWPPNLAHL